jgi:Lsr2
MAVRRVVRFVDDLDGTAAAETVWFGVDGVGYEVDLSAANAAALRTLLDPYVAAGRRVGRVEAGAAGRVRHAVARAQLAAAAAPRSAVAAAVEPAQTEPARAEPAQAEPARAEPARVKPAPVEPDRQDEPPAAAEATPRPAPGTRAEPAGLRFSDQPRPPGH